MTWAQIPATLACCGVWCPAPNSLRGFGRVLHCRSFESNSQRALYYQSFDRSQSSVSPALAPLRGARTVFILVSLCRATSPLTRILQRFLLSISITSTKSSPAALACRCILTLGSVATPSLARLASFVQIWNIAAGLVLRVRGESKKCKTNRRTLRRKRNMPYILPHISLGAPLATNARVLESNFMPRHIHHHHIRWRAGV